MGTGQRHAKDGVRTEVALRGGAVQRDHRFVDADLVGYGHTENLLRNHLVDILHGFQYSLAAVTALIAVTQFERLVFARRCSRRHGRTAESAAGGGYFDFDGRIPAGIQDLSGMNTYNLTHFTTIF